MKTLLLKIPLNMRLPLLILTIGLVIGGLVAFFTSWSTMFITAGIFFVAFYVIGYLNIFGWLYQKFH